ncbi:MAG TPA: hypothetical protein VLT86_14875 [Vicinamibacterales bacterium]|nr:hypothetical protein [Vicinamibacterales bacterium]
MATSVTVVGWMTAACAGSALALVAFVPGFAPRDVVAGMAGPLVAAGVSWLMIDRIARVNPAGLTPLMMVAFAVKLVFFGAYVALALRVLQVAPVPFVVSFTLAFVGLWAAEAVLLHRLAGRRAHAS